jgi:hypothetical protein
MSDILDHIEDLEDDEFGELELDEETDSTDFSTDLVISDDDLEYEMSEGKAREITDAIRAASAATYILLAQAHSGKAYKALGYDTWAEYVKNEFDISASRSYQLLDLSKAIQMIEAVTPEGTDVKLTEAQARDIKRELPKITEIIREETENLAPEQAAEAVDRIVDDIREQKKADEKAIEERERNLADAEQDGYHKGIEAAADAMLEADAAGSMTDGADSEFVEVEVAGDGVEILSPQQKVDLYNFLNVLSGLTSLSEPDDFIATVPAGREEEVTNQLNTATAWLNRFSTLWELRLDD